MEVPGRIHAGPITKALTLQFMNGLGHSLTSVEYAFISPSDGMQSRSSRAKGEQGARALTHSPTLTLKMWGSFQWFLNL